MTCEHLLAIVTGTLTHDFLRYALGAGGVFALVNVALARRLAARKIRRDSPGWTQIRREIRTSLRTVLIFAVIGITVALGAEAGLFPVYARIATHGWPWFWISIALVIVAHDAWFYWTHRLIHRPRLFRLAHRTHHRSYNPSPFAAYAFDIAEAALNALFLPIFVALVPMHETALLIFVIHMMLRNALAHCGYEVFPADAAGHPLLPWLASVTHHDLHHADARWNLGFYFTWWDRLMRTEHPRYAAEFARVAPRLPVRGRGAALVLALAAVIGIAAAEGRAETLSGTYAAPGLGMVVRFVPCPNAQEQICGQLLWGWDMADWKTVPAGRMVVRGLVPDGKGWSGGFLTDPETGRVWRGRVRRHVDGGLSLTGCAGPLCRTQRWRRLGQVRAVLDRLD